MSDLEQAIETITECGQALGVSCDDVYREILSNERVAMDMLENIHKDCPLAQAHFIGAFELYASRLLKEAQRANLELEAGL